LSEISVGYALHFQKRKIKVFSVSAAPFYAFLSCLLQNLFGNYIFIKLIFTNAKAERC